MRFDSLYAVHLFAYTTIPCLMPRNASKEDKSADWRFGQELGFMHGSFSMSGNLWCMLFQVGVEDWKTFFFHVSSLMDKLIVASQEVQK